MAADNGYTPVIDTLLEAGADVDVTNKYNHTPLYFAVYRGYKDVVRKLLNAGASIQRCPILERALDGYKDNQGRVEQSYDNNVNSTKTVQLILLMDNLYWEDNLSSQAQSLLKTYKFDLGSFGRHLKRSKELGKQRSHIIESGFDGYTIPTVLIQLIITYYDSFDERELLLKEVITQSGTDGESTE